MTTYTIPDDASFTGEWWLPSASDANRKIPGTLAWSKNKATLELHDSFTPLRSGPLFQSAQTQPVIHGATTDGNAISVLEASWSHGTMAFGGAQFKRPESFISSLVVIGAHVDKQTLYSEIRVRVPGLQTLLGIGRIDETLVQKTEHSPACMIYRASGMQEERIWLPSLAATLGWGIDRQFSGDRLTSLSITSAAHLRIAPDQPQNLDWYFEQLFKATTLLAFIAGAPMTADQATAKVAASNADVNLMVGWSNPVYCPHRSSHEFFLLRGTMAVNLDTVFQTWFRKYDTVAAPSQLALSVLSSEGLWIHVQFLLLVQALEGFHRAVAEGTRMPLLGPPPIDQRSNNTAPNQETPHPGDQIKPNAKRSAKASLGKRLNNLANHFDPSLRRLIFGGDGEVPSSWVVTRNYYTHWIPQLRSKALSTIEMYYANVRLRHFVRALYLDYVGIPQTAIAKALDGTNSESQHLIQLNHPTATFGHVEVRPTTAAEPKADKPNGETEAPSPPST